MEIPFFLSCQPPIWFSYATGFASLFAVIFTVLYFIRPKLAITNESNVKEIRIKCTNKNCFSIVIKDIKCDIVLSKDDTFNVTDTLELQKDWITGIKRDSNYVFKTKELPKNFKEKKYIKVRILAINLLGIKKYYEKTFEINT